MVYGFDSGMVYEINYGMVYELIMEWFMNYFLVGRGRGGQSRRTSYV